VDVWRGKIILVGETKMGKTSLVRAMTRYVLSTGGSVVVKGIEYMLSDAAKLAGLGRMVTDRTSGIDTWLVKIPTPIPRGNAAANSAKQARQLEVGVWDFGGQETYRTTHQPFLARNTAYLVVFYLGAKNLVEDLSYWYRRVYHVSQEENPVLLIRTHCQQ
jgi:GTPase SAR1 family protein